MTLKGYFQTQPRGSQMQFCREIGITKAWLSLIVHKKRKPSRALAIVISLYTDNQVTVDELMN
jgi:hypothetical protein